MGRISPRAGRAVRKGMYWIHLWFGLSIGLYFVAMGLTGSLIVFIDDLKPMIAPELRHVAPPFPGAKPLPLSQVMIELKRQLPKAKEEELAALSFPEEAGGAYTLNLGAFDDMFGQREATVDPYTGRVLGNRRVITNVLGFAYLFHIYLILGMKGFLVNGYLGILTALLTGTGIWLWWPKTLRQLRIRLSVKWGAEIRRLFYDLHNAFGMYSLPVMLVIILTGVTFAFYTPILNVVNQLTHSPRPPEEKKFTVPKDGVSKRLPIETLIGIAERTAPTDARIYNISYPTKPEDAFTCGKLRGMTGIFNYASVKLDPYRGTVLFTDDERTAPLGNRITIFWTRLHFGWWGGWATKILYALVGLTPLGLYVTGIWTWWLKRKAKVAAKRRRQTPDREALPEDELSPTLAGSRVE